MGPNEFLGVEIITEYGISLLGSKDMRPSENVVKELRLFISSFFQGKVSLKLLKEQFIKHQKPEEIATKLSFILNEALNHQKCKAASHKNRIYKQPRHWTENEDNRLLAAILIFGDTNWIEIAKFVGMGRNRPMCNQRWTRTLNPKISKDSWSIEEEELLTNLVNEEDSIISWTKIAHKIGTRTDVQCRYHYEQMRRKKLKNQASSPERGPCIRPIPSIIDDMVVPQKVLQIGFFPMKVSDFLNYFKN